MLQFKILLSSKAKGVRRRCTQAANICRRVLALCIQAARPPLRASLHQKAMALCQSPFHDQSVFWVNNPESLNTPPSTDCPGEQIFWRASIPGTQKLSAEIRRSCSSLFSLNAQLHHTPSELVFPRTVLLPPEGTQRVFEGGNLPFQI